MRLTVRDVLATLFVATAAALYGMWVTGAALAGLSTRMVAVVVFGLGWRHVARASIGWAGPRR